MNVHYTHCHCQSSPRVAACFPFGKTSSFSNNRRARWRWRSNGRSIGILGLGLVFLVCGIASVKANPRAEAGDKPPVVLRDRVWNTGPADRVQGNFQKFMRHAQRIVRKYDRDGSGVLEKGEWAAVPGEPQKIDRKKDGVLTVEELAEFAARFARLHPLKVEDNAWQNVAQPLAWFFQPVTPAEKTHSKPPLDEVGTPPGPPSSDEAKPADEAAPANSDDAEKPAAEATPSAQTSAKEGKRGGNAASRTQKYHAELPAGVPDWFRERDADGDGQLTFGEFAADGSAAQRKVFERYDPNGDGVVTAEELSRSSSDSSDDGEVSAAKEATATKKSKASGKKPLSDKQ